MAHSPILLSEETHEFTEHTSRQGDRWCSVTSTTKRIGTYQRSEPRLGKATKKALKKAKVRARTTTKRWKHHLLQEKKDD